MLLQRWMRTRWPRGGSHHDDLAFWCGAAVRFVHVGGVRNHAALAAKDDGSVRCVLLCAVRGWDDCSELGDVVDQALIGGAKAESPGMMAEIAAQTWCAARLF